MGYLRRRKLRKLVDAALHDGILTNDEIGEIESARSELGISEEFVKELRHSDFLSLIEPIRKKIIRTRRFSPDDEKELAKISKNLRIDPIFDSSFNIYRQ